MDKDEFWRKYWEDKDRERKREKIYQLLFDLIAIPLIILVALSIPVLAVLALMGVMG